MKSHHQHHSLVSLCYLIWTSTYLLAYPARATSLRISRLSTIPKKNNTSSSSMTSFWTTIGLDVHGDAVRLPLVGAGTWQHNSTIAHHAACNAFRAGYTMVDTAFVYDNQDGVGAAISECWKKPREDLFVLTKVPGGLTPKEVHSTHAFNLRSLGLEYVDHLMVHYPSNWNGIKGASKEARQQSWLAMEGIYYSGKARSIGVSHYCIQHLEDILEVATVMPSINQVEYHVGSQDVDNVMDFCQEKGIQFMSFSPLCGPCQYDDEDSLINGTLVSEIAAQYDHVTPNQVALRYIVQQGIPVIPKSHSFKHLLSNLDLFDFELSAGDMCQLGRAARPAPREGDCDIP